MSAWFTRAPLATSQRSVAGDASCAAAIMSADCCSLHVACRLAPAASSALATASLSLASASRSAVRPASGLGASSSEGAAASAAWMPARSPAPAAAVKAAASIAGARLAPRGLGAL